jgi:hypothetical protein
MLATARRWSTRIVWYIPLSAASVRSGHRAGRARGRLRPAAASCCLGSRARGVAGGPAGDFRRCAAERSLAGVGERCARADGRGHGHAAAHGVPGSAAGRGVRVHAPAASGLHPARHQTPAGDPAARARARLRPDRDEQPRPRGVPADHAAAAHTVVGGPASAGRVVRRGVFVVRPVRADRVRRALRDLRVRPDAGAASRDVRADPARRSRPHAARARACPAAGHG